MTARFTNARSMRWRRYRRKDDCVKSLESKPQTVAIASIIVGKRHRLDLGNIDALARSIAEVGLLHPIPIRPDCILIAGVRRLAACKTLGWQDIPVHVVELDKISWHHNLRKKGRGERP
jgi:hypothetical protein